MATPHDHLFRRVFARPEQTAGLFRSAMTPEQSAALDWDALATVSGDFLDGRLLAFQIDLLFQTRLAADPDRAAFLLVEHKSWHDAGAARKLRRYAELVRERHAALHPGSPEAIVIPLVVHHGRRPWHPGDDRRRRRRSSAPPPALARFLPWHPILLLDLARLDEAAVRALPLPPIGSLSLLCLQFLPGRRPHVVEGCLQRWADLLVEVHARDPGHAAGALSSYILYTTEMPAARLGALLGELLGTQPEESLMSTAEKLIQKGRKQGQTDLLLRQLAHRFGPLPAETETRIRSGASTDLERWADAVLTAKTLDEVFASA